MLELVRTRGGRGNATTVLERSFMSMQGFKASGGVDGRFATLLSECSNRLRDWILAKIGIDATELSLVRRNNARTTVESC